MQNKKQLVFQRTKNLQFEEINFSEVSNLARFLAKHIEANFEAIADILLEYESYEVVRDEVDRTIDLLTSLHENREFFALRIGAVTSFLPKNQPLYAFTCFVVIPSLMATEVHFRIPHSMKHFFGRLYDLLNIKLLFKNIYISTKERQEFLEDRTALKVDSVTNEAMPVTDVVIFTGTPHHAERLRLIFDKKTLFISNGAGHNPIIVSEGADIAKAVEAVLTLQLYNQGQDCAAPNAILVHNGVYSEFLKLLRRELIKVKVGSYRDRTCRVGPISEPEDLNRIQAIFVENRYWLDPQTPGIIRTSDAIVEPTIITKPLNKGGNFTEVFAPIFFIQKYKIDSELSVYFEDARYERNAMYISLYGKSNYVAGLASKSISGKILHDADSIFRNIHLHHRGVERGTKPYGGYGYAASSISINGEIFSKPTLPQRDIYDYLVKPILKNHKIQKQKNLMKHAKILIKKDIRKILGIKSNILKANELQTSYLYFDSKDEKFNKKRYILLKNDKIFSLLLKQNINHVASMDADALKSIRILHNFLKRSKKNDPDSFNKFLYLLGENKKSFGKRGKKNKQSSFFRDLYQLLLGKDFGPRLATFILEADRNKVIELLNV